MLTAASYSITAAHGRSPPTASNSLLLRRCCLASVIYANQFRDVPSLQKVSHLRHRAMRRNLSSLHWISTAGVCGFIYTAIAIVYESSKVRNRHILSAIMKPTANVYASTVLVDMSQNSLTACQCALQIVSHREDKWDGARLFVFDFQVCQCWCPQLLLVSS